MRFGLDFCERSREKVFRASPEKPMKFRGAPAGPAPWGAEPRREFIEKNAKNVVNLDI